MTLKLFWADPYLTRLETRIVAVAGDEVTVAETIFYAFSGGQESDHGTLDRREVLAARKAGRQRFYQAAGRHPRLTRVSRAMGIYTQCLPSPGRLQFRSGRVLSHSWTQSW